MGEYVCCRTMHRQMCKCNKMHSKHMKMFKLLKQFMQMIFHYVGVGFNQTQQKEVMTTLYSSNNMHMLTMTTFNNFQ